MVGRTLPITKDDRAHFARLRAMPCVCCRIEGMSQPNRTTAHHLLSGGRRRGHQQSIPLCEWHHLGKHLHMSDTEFMTKTYGPSLAFGSKPFRERYGSDDKLLSTTQGDSR